MEWVAVARWEELAEGVPAVRIVEGAPILLVRRGKQVHALPALCPHKAAPLSEGTILDGRVTCPQHEATFDLATGRPDPDDAWAGRLDIVPVQVRGGEVCVAVAPTTRVNP